MRGFTFFLAAEVCSCCTSAPCDALCSAGCSFGAAGHRQPRAGRGYAALHATGAALQPGPATNFASTQTSRVRWAFTHCCCCWVFPFAAVVAAPVDNCASVTPDAIDCLPVPACSPLPGGGGGHQVPAGLAEPAGQGARRGGAPQQVGAQARQRSSSSSSSSSSRSWVAQHVGPMPAQASTWHTSTSSRSTESTGFCLSKRLFVLWGVLASSLPVLRAGGRLPRTCAAA